MSHISHRKLKPLAALLVAMSFTAVVPAAFAQDRDEHRDERRDEGREHVRDDHVREERHEDRDVDRFRHEHPHASARCHDGFFTSTHDRDRACRRHGGIDIWLML